MHSNNALLFPTDINECVEAAMNNQQICNMTQSCENTLGSFQCICPGGTQLNMHLRMHCNTNTYHSITKAIGLLSDWQ